MDKIGELKLILSDQNRKPLHKIVRELIHCAFIEREIPSYYFTSLLYKEGTGNYKDYIGYKKVSKIQKEVYFKNGKTESLINKLEFADVLRKNEVPTPLILANSNGFELYADEEIIKIENAQKLEEEIYKLIYKSPHNSIFVKKIDGFGGFNAFKFADGQIDNQKVDDLYKLMSKYSFIFQETVFQHEKVNQIYADSINTVRVHTFREGEIISLVSALMRFGGNGSVVDNISSGGCFVPVNISDWSLGSRGISFLEYGGHIYTEHPDTGFKFEGFKIPYGDQIAAVAEKAALLFDNDFIGWDVVITNEGPTIIEGNQNPHIIMTQMACGGFKRHPVFKEIFKDYI